MKYLRRYRWGKQRRAKNTGDCANNKHGKGNHQPIQYQEKDKDSEYQSLAQKKTAKVAKHKPT